MPISDNTARWPAGTVLRVPFPYTDGQTTQHRPALLVGRSGPGGFLVWVVMITSDENRGWPGDIPVAANPSTGLPVPSVIRCAKIATIDARRAESRGQVDAATLWQVLATVRGMLAPDP